MEFQMPPKKQTLEQRVLIMFRNSSLGLTDDELVHHISDANPGTIKNVRCKYVAAGELLWDGTTRESRTGRKVKVFRFAGDKMRERDKKRDMVSTKVDKKSETRVDKSADIREAIGGLLSIIRLIETQLPRHIKKRK
jgi:hypothetical protein